MSYAQERVSCMQGRGGGGTDQKGYIIPTKEGNTMYIPQWLPAC